MEPNQSAEAIGRGLRGSVVIASVILAGLLLWMIKGAFVTEPSAEPQVPSRQSSFQGRNIASAGKDVNDPQVPSNNSAKARSSEIAAANTPAPLPTSIPGALPVVAVPTTSAAAVNAGPPTRASAAPVTSDSISGKVTLRGTPPPESFLPLDPGCGNFHAGVKPTTQFYSVSSDGGLADVFVYISKGFEGRVFLPPANALVLDQVKCLYTPYVSGAQTGQTIEVRNSDPVLHNVHPTPAVTGNAEVNKAMLPKMPPLLFSWKNPEVFLRFKCDVHPWMFAYVGLVSHPYFAVTDAEGNYTIAHVPPGTYEVEFVHRKAGKISAPIIVTAGANATLSQVLDVPAK
jgi:hypothetical protein